MESRGPHDAGAPSADLMDTISVIDKSTSDGDHWHSGNSITKNNNRLLFFTVEYVEDNQLKDYSKMFLPYEQVSLSPRASSPSLDFEHRVSPLDPNMSSAARYSPTPVPLSSAPYQNSVMVLQSPPLPLINPNDPNSRPHINYVPSDATNASSTSQIDNVTDFVNSSTEEGLVTGVGGELILMQGTNTEIGNSAAPLMLTSIPGTDFTLARDFLVMHDDQLNIINPLQNQNSETTDEQIKVVNLNGSDKVEKKSIDICKDVIASDDLLQDNDENLYNKITNTTTKKLDLRRSKRYINDKEAFTDDLSAKTGTSLYQNVRTIADQPVPSRAIATLPGSYLTINKLSTGMDYGVYAKRHIRPRTQFGPVEGILCSYDEKLLNDGLPLIYETNDGQLLKIDISDENTSNWMRFVRPASTYRDQNLIICQQNDGIVFLTSRSIAPKEELRAGPSLEYASRRNLSVLQPDLADDKWSCFECNEYFSSPEKLQYHLQIHNDSMKNNGKTRNKRKNLSVNTNNKLLKVVDGQTLIYTCPQCPKVFPRSYSLKRHMLMHPGAKHPRYECSTCGESFLHPYNRSRHIKIFHNDGTREKENSRQNITEWKCSTCNLAFDKACLLNIHNQSHGEGIITNENNQSYVCPQCGADMKSNYELINHVSKHGRLKSTKASTMVNVSSHKCTMCYKRFATKVRLQQHFLVHGAEDQKPLPCNICCKRFMNNSALSCHLKTHRQDKQIFECPMCRQLFNQVPMLKDHIEIHKNPDGTFSCPHCPRNFMKYSVIRKHIRAHHCERKHNCQFCVKRFPTIDKLRMHLLRHSDHREFHCANCEKQFKRKDKLKEHMTRMHNAQRTEKKQILQGNGGGGGGGDNNNQAKKFVPKVNPTDYNRFLYKCHQCLVGFKRRGMLVNHLAKRHPEVPPDSVPELNLPILRQTRDYYCQYCDKVYKSSSKRKAHIVKNHPGAALPPSNRQKEIDMSGLPNPTFSQTVGSITTTPQSCPWCHKQYASKAKLLQHQRKKHATLMEPADQRPRPRNRPPQNHSPQLTDDNNFIMSDYLQTYDIDVDILKPKIMKITNDVDLINHNLDLIGPQFVRIRDIR